MKEPIPITHTAYTAIFGTIEAPKEPLLITPGWKYILYTDQDGFESRVWEIIKVPKVVNTRLESRKYKALFWNYVDTEFSMWCDGSFRINTNLNWFWTNHFKNDFSAPLHPQRKDMLEEGKAIIEAKRGGGEGVEKQMEIYKSIVPKNNGLIAAGILLRRNSERCRELCTAWYKETSDPNNCQRDQMSFTKVSLDFNDVISNFVYPYNRRSELIYHPHSNFIIGNKEYM
jgi:hypothetical protein